MSRTAPAYVQREVLAGIADVFDADAIWQAPGLALFARRALLRDLLERGRVVGAAAPPPAASRT
jgi:hypothetical protein